MLVTILFWRKRQKKKKKPFPKSSIFKRAHGDVKHSSSPDMDTGNPKSRRDVFRTDQRDFRCKVALMSAPCNQPRGVDQVRSPAAEKISAGKEKTLLETTDAQRRDFECLTAHLSCTVLKVLQEDDHQGARAFCQ